MSVQNLTLARLLPGRCGATEMRYSASRCPASTDFTPVPWHGNFRSTGEATGGWARRSGAASPWHGVSLSPGTQPILMNVADQGRITARHNSGSSPKTCIFPGKSTTGWNGTSTLTILAKGSWARRDGWPSYCERMIFWFGQTPVPSPLSAATAAHLPRHGSSEPVTAIRSKKQGQRVSAPPSGKQLRFHALPHADRGALT